jgi:hypothetical protein
LNHTIGLTGKQICRLMRKHHVTIKALSKRMGITMKRIRHVRTNGLTDSPNPYHYSWNWIEAITGKNPGPHWWYAIESDIKGIK